MTVLSKWTLHNQSVSMVLRSTYWWSEVSVPLWTIISRFENERGLRSTWTRMMLSLFRKVFSFRKLFSSADILMIKFETYDLMPSVCSRGRTAHLYLINSSKICKQVSDFLRRQLFNRCSQIVASFFALLFQAHIGLMFSQNYNTKVEHSILHIFSAELKHEAEEA